MNCTIDGTARCLAAGCLALGALLAAPAEGVEVWTPETGEVELNDVPVEGAEARRARALALIAAGQWTTGMEELEALIAEDPEAAWVPEARFAIIRARMGQGEPVKAFDEMEQFGARHAGTEFAREAREAEFAAARMAAEQDVDSGVKLFNRLIDTAGPWGDEEEASIEMADALFDAGRYLDAQAEYAAFTDIYAGSEKEPHCWYRLAECEWERARSLGLGTELYEDAEARFREFIVSFPADPLVPDAEAKANEARNAQAGMFWLVARYYIDAAHKPWAAVNSLEHIVTKYPGAPVADEAAKELEEILDTTPVRPGIKAMEMPGAGWADEEEAE